MNPKMFNSFIDGSKSGIEMTAVSNATGLLPQDDGLAFPPCPAPELAKVCKPREKGGLLSRRGTVEVVSFLGTGTHLSLRLRSGRILLAEGPAAWADRFRAGSAATARWDADALVAVRGPSKE